MNGSENKYDASKNVILNNRRCFRAISLTSKDSKARSRTFIWKKKTFLLKKSKSKYYPNLKEVASLNENGFGYSKTLIPEFDLKQDLDDLEDDICSLYPTIPLQRIGFRYAKCGRDRKFNFANDVNSINDLKKFIGQSTLMIVPNEDIPIRNTDESLITIQNDCKPEKTELENLFLESDGNENETNYEIDIKFEEIEPYTPMIQNTVEHKYEEIEFKDLSYSNGYNEDDNEIDTKPYTTQLL